MLSGAHLPVPNAVLLKPSSCPSRGTGRKYQCGPVRCGREQRFLTANIFHYRLAYRPVAWSLAPHLEWSLSEAKRTSFGTGAEWIGRPPPAGLAADAHPLLSAVFVAISRKTAAALLSKPRPRVENSRARTIACSRGAPPAVASVTSQAAYEGSIPFARSNRSP